MTLTTGARGDRRNARFDHAPQPLPAAGRTVPPATVLRETARHYGLTRGQLRRPDRFHAKRARQVCCYLLHQLSRLSYNAIAPVVGIADHSTVSHACRSVDGALVELQSDVVAITYACRRALNPACTRLLSPPDGTGKATKCIGVMEPVTSEGGELLAYRCGLCGNLETLQQRKAVA